MFLWSGRQAIFILVTLGVCAIALSRPAWRHTFGLTFSALCIVMVIIALDYVLRK